MKKIYLLFTLLLTMLGATTAFAQDEATIHVTMNDGKWIAWNANESNPWARSWYSTTTPAISIVCMQGGNKSVDIRGKEINNSANNMSVWDATRTELMFFTNYGTYEITVEEGWYLTSVEFDYDCANNENKADGQITLTLGDSEPVTSADIEDVQHVAWENNDEEVYSVQFIVNRDEGTYNFARTRNFYVTVKKLGEAKTALQELQSALDKYEGYHFMAGSEPGNYGEAEVAAFQAAIQTAHDADGNPDLDDLSDAELASYYRNLVSDIKAAYEAVLAARNTTITLADGYYRIKTGLQYYTTETITDEETGEETSQTVYHDKYMTSILSGENIVGRWQSVDDIDNDCTSLWKVTNKDGYVDLVNMATESRFNSITATSGVMYMSLASQNLVELDPFITYEGTTYVNIRRAPVEGETYGNEGYWYFHQGGHSSGKGTQGNLVLWSSSGSYNPNNDTPVFAGGSEWVFIPVDEALAEAIIKAYEPEKDITLMKERYKMILADAKEKLEIAKDIQSSISDEALITDVAQFSSPSTEPSEGSLDALIDGNAGTFWHSAWSGGNVPNGTHYLQVEITESDVTAAALTITRRQAANDHITEWGVYGTNEAEAEKEDCEQLAVLSTPFGNNTETVSSSAFETKGYKYLRFYINATTTGRGYGHVSEFQLYKATIIDSPTTQYKVMGDIAKNLDNVLEAQKSLEIDDLTKEEYEALKAAYDAFMEKFVDPAELRETLASVQDAGEGVVIGTNPGYWTDNSASSTLSSTITAATAYDKAGAYTQEQSDKYVADLKAQSDALTGSAIGVKEGKWYRIRFASEADFETHEWDKIAGYNENNTDAPLWNKYLTVAHYESLPEVEDGERPYEIEPLDVEDASLGENIFFVADGDIANKDMSMFRFIAVGDSAYIIQNKATNLFLKATSGSSTVTLNAHPSLFNVKAVGYGFNVIAAENINGTSQNYLHGQKLYNVLVTWNAYTLGSASAMYIEDAGDVAADYEGTEFQIPIVYGALNAFCFPVDITANEGQMWTVSSVDPANSSVTLVKLEKGEAGRPFIYINGTTDDYAEGEKADMIKFNLGYEIKATEPQTESALKGTFESVVIDRGELYCKGNQFVVNTIEKDAIMVELTRVAANRAYISADSRYSTASEVTIIWDENGEDGIEQAIAKVSKNGAIYTIDGKLVTKSGNLNDASRYGKGVYILNGVKVVVK
ncbi:MAG: discoidin domain-containing protein [Bacteroidaceae bacterium]|nr:discoidin domain-containing protein [Bacteroidaceae bacterium]